MSFQIGPRCAMNSLLFTNCSTTINSSVIISVRSLCSSSVIVSSSESKESSVVNREINSTSTGRSIASKRRESSVALPTVFLPSDLKDSLFKILSNYPPKSLIRDGEDIVHYLTNRGPSSPLRYNKREAIGFAAGRTEAVYGSTYRVMRELSKIDKDFAPQTMLDFGSGLGTAVWAANSVWGNSLYEYQTIDTSPDMGELARVLRSGGDEWASISDSSLTLPTDIGEEAIKGVYFRQYLPVSSKRTYDLVVSAYTLSEIPTMTLWIQALLSLWRKTEQYLVLIEVSSPSGFSIISKAREIILKDRSGDDGRASDFERGHVVAPCPHDYQCPLLLHMEKEKEAERERRKEELREESRQELEEGEGKEERKRERKREREKERKREEQMLVCGFGQRVAVPFSQYKAHRANGFYIEHFSYLVLKKGPRPSDTKLPPSRILVPTKKRSRHTLASLCCPNGEAKTVTLTKGKHKELQSLARRKQWGDTLDVPIELYDDNEKERRKEKEREEKGKERRERKGKEREEKTENL